MGHLRIVGLTALAATALMALAGTASADQVTSPTGTAYTTTIAAESEGHITFDNPIALISCNSSIKASVETHGPGEPVSGAISQLTFTNCTNDWHFTVVFGGLLLVETSSAGYNGVVYWKGTTIESTRFGVNCRYATSSVGNGTKIGTITGGEPATLHIEAAIPFHSGSFLCGSGVTAWTGSYKVSTPGSLYVDNT